MNPKKSSKNTGALNTLRQSLSVEEWQQALASAKAQRASAAPELDRRDRQQKRHQAVRRCLLRVDRGEAAPGIYVVRSSDISSGGLRLIHGGAIDPDTICCVIIETEQGQSIAAGGVVAWCNPIDDTDPPAYELGVRFYTPIDADIFADQSDPAEEAA
ncbi:MAG: PilZ domain-containing protein [Phycisphaerales bacterium]